MAEKREVSREEYLREVAELHRLRVEYEAKWRRLKGTVRNVRRWETRIRELEARLETLKAGLPPTWREYLRVRDVLLPRARTRLSYWIEQRERIISEIISTRGEIRRLEAEIARKVVVPPPPRRERVQVRVYIIIEKGVREYTWEGLWRGKWIKRKIVRKYPSGAFQGWYECDALVKPDTMEVLTEEEPFKSAIRKIKEDFVDEISKEWFYATYDPEDVTVGESNVIPKSEDIGKPPKKIRVARTVDKPVPPKHYPTEDWFSPTLDRWIS